MDYCLIEDYELPHDYKEWSNCPNCGLKPKVWIFNNGRSTGCACGKTKYDHFSIHAESVMSVYSRCGDTKKYKSNTLKKNWNHWIETGEILFEHASKRTDGKW